MATQNLREAIGFASTRWGASSTPALELKGAISGAETTDNSSAMGVGASDAEFLDVVLSESFFGKMPFRRVPSGIPVVLQSGLATAYWVGQSKAIPMSRAAFTRESISSFKIAAMTVFSKELAESGTDLAVASIQNDLKEAGVRLLELTLIDGANAGSATIPAAITNGVTPIASTGDLADDVDAAIAAFTGSLRNASWIMSPRLAAQAGIRSGGRGVAADLGARGGTLAGLPVLTSESFTSTSNGQALVLVDASAIIVVDDGLSIERSSQSMVELSDTPTGATDTPTAATQQLVSLWQSEAVAARMVYRTNWLRGRAGSVVVVEAAAYTAP